MTLTQSTSDTVFLTWEWIAAWWKNYGAGRALYVLSAWEGDALLGVAPLYVDRIRRFGIGWICLKLIGAGSDDSDYLDCFARPGRETEVIRAFVAYLDEHRDEWDQLELDGTPENSPCGAAMIEAAQARSWKLSTSPVPCASLVLPRPWNAYLQTLKPRFRTKVRSALAFLDEHMRETPLRCADRAQLPEWLHILFELHTKRWQSAGLPGVFRDPVKRAFYLDVSERMLERGWLALDRLNWGERSLAIQYGFLYGKRFYLLQEGYDPTFESLRPGLSLRAALMRCSIEEGLAEYDFLAGTAPHKMEWGARQKLSLRTQITHSPMSTLVFQDGPRVHQHVKDRIRPFVPEFVLAWRKSQKQKKVQKSSAVEAPGNRSLHNTVRSLIGWFYGSTPAGRLGRHLAGRYVLGFAGNGRRLTRLHRRLDPILHILIYHRINDDDDPYMPALPVSAFRAQMQYLAANFPVIGLDHVADGGTSSCGDSYRVAITFDDGYRDNFLNAFPILKELGLPATIFLTTRAIESGELPWYDKVCLAFKLTTQQRLELSGEGVPTGSLEGHAVRLRTLSQTLEWLWGLPEPDRLHCTNELLRALRAPQELTLPNTMLDWEEVRGMSKHGITFGAHTVTHPVLSRLCTKRLEEEIYGSKEIIENRLRLPVRHFAYPFGRRQDFNEATKQVVREAGFATAVTTVRGFNFPDEDRFELKRFSPWETNRASFALKLDWYRFAGIYDKPKLLGAMQERSS